MSIGWSRPLAAFRLLGKFSQTSSFFNNRSNLRGNLAVRLIGVGPACDRPTIARHHLQLCEWSLLPPVDRTQDDSNHGRIATIRTLDGAAHFLFITEVRSEIVSTNEKEDQICKV